TDDGPILDGSLLPKLNANGSFQQKEFENYRRELYKLEDVIQGTMDKLDPPTSEPRPLDGKHATICKKVVDEILWPMRDKCGVWIATIEDYRPVRPSPAT
ncbi:MAG: hypothetical protein Q9180_002124, partial [Flavoplaca navasiana]